MRFTFKENAHKMNNENVITVTMILEDPSTPKWIADIAREAMYKDPVDAASGLDVLAEAFEERADRLLNPNEEG